MAISSKLHGKLLVRCGHLEYCLRRDDIETIYIAYCRFRDTIVEVGNHNYWKKHPEELRKYMNLLHSCETKMRIYGANITGIAPTLSLSA